jgi:phosphoglycolate phosphatase
MTGQGAAMTGFPFAIVGFDLDGTLVDSAEDLRSGANAALVSIGLPPLTPEQIRPAIGGGARRMLALGLSLNGGDATDEAMIDRLFPIFIAHYEANLVANTGAFPGCEAALDALAARGVTLAVVTNKLEAMARTLLGELGLAHRFATIIGRDTLGPGRAKPSPDPIIEMIARCGGGRSAFVGDSSFDVDAARAAGVPAVACAFGYPDRAVETLGADAIIGHYEELIPTLQQLGGQAQ